jgi:hypothetical protein
MIVDWGQNDTESWGQDDEPIGQGRSWWREPVPEKLQRIGKAARDAWEVGGIIQVKMMGGAARGVTEPIPDRLQLPGGYSLDLASGLQTRIQEWGEQTVAAADQYFRENPERITDIQSSGLLPVIGELLSNPDKLLGAMIENLPLLLEGTLATVATGGLGGGLIATQLAGGGAMTIPLFGDYYNEARAEGATPNEALARAIIGAPIEAGIEQFTLGKKLGLMRSIMGGKSIGGLKGLAWEVNKAYWRGTAEEGTQQFNRNVWRWVFTDRSADLMKGVIKSASLGGPLEAAYAGVFAGAGFISTPHSARERMQRLDKIRKTVEIDGSLDGAVKTEINNTIDIIEEDIIEEQVEVLIERYSQLIEDDKSLTELGDAMAKDFGIEDAVEFRFKVKKDNGNWGLHQVGKAINLHTITIYSRPGHNTQRIMKETLVHEFGHIVKPPKENKKPPLLHLPKGIIFKQDGNDNWRAVDEKTREIIGLSNTKKGATKMALRAINSKRQFPRRRTIHYPEFKEWVSEAVKVLDPKRITVAASEVAKVVEEKEIEAPPPMAEDLNKPAKTVLKEHPKLRVANWSEGKIYIGNLGETHAHIAIREELDYKKVVTGFVDNTGKFHSQLPTDILAEKSYAQTYLAQLPAKPTESRYDKLDPTQQIKIATVEGTDTMTVEDAVYRLDEISAPEYYDGLAAEESALASQEIRAIQSELNKLLPVPTERYEAKIPKKKSKKALRYLGHEIPKRNGLSEAELKEDKVRVTKQFSDRDGIDSMGKMTQPEMANWVSYLEEKYGGIEYTKEDLEKPIQVGNRVTNMVSLLREIDEQLEKLPDRVKIPEHITRGYRKKLEGGRAKRTWDFLMGIDNSNMSTLAWILGGGKDSVFTDIFRDEIARGKKNQDAHIMSVYQYLRKQLTEAKITDDDLARMSRGANPRFTFLDRELMPNLGIETEVLKISIGNRTYDVTWGHMIDLYLTGMQEEGETHLLGGGLEIEGVETGALTDDELNDIRAEVESNSKAMEVIRLFRNVDDNVWKQSINQTSMQLDNKKIATVENWWGLEPAVEDILPGKKRKFNVNLLENKRILHERTKSSIPLVLRDAFSRFDKFEKAIAEYTGMAEPIRTVRTVLNHQKVARGLKDKGYGRVRDNMLTILKRAQSTPEPEGSFGKLTRDMLHGAYRAILYFSAKIVASQKTSEIVYSAYTNPKYYPAAAKEALSRKAMDAVLQMSPIAWTRFFMGYSSYELGEVAAQDNVLQGFTGKASWKNKAGLGLKMADLSALTTGMEIAKAEYLDAQKGTVEGESAIWWANRRADFKEDTEPWRQAVSERAEFLWQQTQPSWDKWNRSRNLSQPVLITRIASGMLFRSFHEKALNVTQQALVEFQGSPKDSQDYTRASRKIGAVMASYAVNTAIRAIILATMTGKIKEPWEYLTNLVTSPFSMITLLGRQLQQTVENFVRVAKGEKVQFYGKIGEQLPFSIIQTMIDATNNYATGTAFFLRGDEERGEENYKKALKRTYESIGLLQGVPIYEIRRVTERLKEETGKGRVTY